MQRLTGQDKEVALYSRDHGEPLKNFKQGRDTSTYIFRRPLLLVCATWIERARLVMVKPINREPFHYSENKTENRVAVIKMGCNGKFKIHFGESC